MDKIINKRLFVYGHGITNNENLEISIIKCKKLLDIISKLNGTKCWVVSDGFIMFNKISIFTCWK